MTEREAYLVLNMLSGIGPVRLAALQEFVDAVEEIILWGLENGFTFLPLQPDSPNAHHGVAN